MHKKNNKENNKHKKENNKHLEVTDKQMEQLADFSKLELSKDEANKLKIDLGDMIDRIKIIKDVDTKGIEPMINVNSYNIVFRDDIVENKNLKQNQDLALRNAPDTRDDFIVVPKILE